jgi:hypothetical protein
VSFLVPEHRLATRALSGPLVYAVILQITFPAPPHFAADV